MYSSSAVRAESMFDSFDDDTMARHRSPQNVNLFRGRSLGHVRPAHQKDSNKFAVQPHTPAFVEKTFKRTTFGHVWSKSLGGEIADNFVVLARYWGYFSFFVCTVVGTSSYLSIGGQRNLYYSYVDPT